MAQCLSGQLMISGWVCRTNSILYFRVQMYFSKKHFLGDFLEEDFKSFLKEHRLWICLSLCRFSILLSLLPRKAWKKLGWQNLNLNLLSFGIEDNLVDIFRLHISPNFNMDLSKLLNVLFDIKQIISKRKNWGKVVERDESVWIYSCSTPNCKMYFSKLGNEFFWIANYICWCWKKFKSPLKKFNRHSGTFFSG